MRSVYLSSYSLEHESCKNWQVGEQRYCIGVERGATAEKWCKTFTDYRVVKTLPLAANLNYLDNPVSHMLEFAIIERTK